jgi:hypothetical protein
VYDAILKNDNFVHKLGTEPQPSRIWTKDITELMRERGLPEEDVENQERQNVSERNP